MAERKAVNKYYPPDWDPRKGSVNKRVGQHPLRDRAKKLGQGILVIRFELPYNIWCGGCGSHVGMGVRYNAEKSKVGNYYTTPIYKFRMKCHLCDNYFEIQTDPKNHDYVILCGARRKEQRWDPVANEQIVPEDKATHKKMMMDAMYKLEHGTDDQVKGKDKVKNLAELESSRLSMKEDYLLNRMARDKFRVEKKQLKEIAEADKSLRDRGALDIELVDETEEDRNLAGLLKYSVTSSYEEKQKEKRKSIEQRPLFELSKSSSDTPSSSSTKSSEDNDSNEGTKQKLGDTLRRAREDPFAIAKSVKLFDAKSNKASTLGIRLKHSKVIKRSKGKLSISKKAVRSHLTLSAESSTNPLIKSNSNNVSSTPSSKTLSPQSNSNYSTVTSNSVSLLTDKQFTTVPGLELTNISNSVLLNEHSMSPTSPSKCDIESKCYKDNEVMSEFTSKNATISDIITVEHESQPCDTSTASNSGLSILINSYDDSDSSASS